MFNIVIIGLSKANKKKKKKKKKKESTTVMQKLIAKTLKDPLCAPVSQGILGMELTAQVKTIPRSSL